MRDESQGGGDPVPHRHAFHPIPGGVACYCGTTFLLPSPPPDVRSTVILTGI